MKLLRKCGLIILCMLLFLSFPVNAKAASTLSISGYGSLTCLKEGQGFLVKGTITSNYSITKVTGYIATSGGTIKYSKTVTPNTTTYNVSGLDSYMLFDKLSAGSYVFKIDATDSSGTSKNLLKQSFTVEEKEESTLSITGYGSLSSIKEGQGFSVKGTVSSNYSITKVTAYIATSSGTIKYTKTATPNATSYNVSGLDSGMLFDKLTAGNYVFKIDATDSSGTSKNLLKQSFTVEKKEESTLAITGYGSLSSIKEGQGFSVKGTVSSNYSITKVTAYIATSSGTIKYTKTATPNATSYNVSGLDSAMLFDKLTAGSYVFKIDAADSSGTSKNLLKQSFTVEEKGESTLAITGYRSLSSIKQGQGFSVKGTVSSSYVITKVTAYIATSSGTILYTKSATPNAKTYDVSGLDSAMLFDKLTVGSYVFKIDATDNSGTFKNVLNQSFTVTESSGTSVNVSGDKKLAMEEAKKRLISDGYELEFVAGVLANIKHEGTLGLFESSHYISNPDSEPAYLVYMDEHCNYRTNFSGKTIFDVGISAAQQLQKAAENSGFEGKFGLGMIQWTGSRTTGLLELYAHYAASDIPTESEAIKAEVNYMADELMGAYRYVYNEWKAGDKTAYSAAKIICEKYEVPKDTANQALLRASDAPIIYEEMLK